MTVESICGLWAVETFRENACADGPSLEERVEERTQVGIECPQCHWRQFVEIEVDSQLLKSPLALEIRHHLEEWVKSRCPDHLGPILEHSKN